MGASYDIATPDAGAMIESLRAFGYDLPTALADLIDNSISAQARNIWIDFSWAGDASRITIRDDGKGMSERELVNAMRPGSTSPITVRDETDLGRFGLGLKTASFAQCRRLTVLSRAADSDDAVRCWDLDYVVREGRGEWRLLKDADLASDEDRKLLEDLSSGTVVFWDKLDRLIGQASADDEVAQRHFRERIDDVKRHVAMVFHRFLSGRGAINIFLNGREVEPWDPFLENAGITDRLTSDPLQLSGERIEVQPYVLPHHSRISKEVHKETAGPRGWNAHQGFYVYRNRRLLVAGDWLGLGMQKEEHYKLARIRVDLPNSMDDLWHIDVRKAKARPPSALRADFRRIARATRERAAKVYRHRGKYLQRQHSREHVFVWKSRVREGKTFYKINRDHPLVRKVLGESPASEEIGSLLTLIEQTVPVPLMVIKNAEEPDTLGQPFEDTPSQLKIAMRDVFNALLDDGLSRKEAAENLVIMEPFSAYPEVVAGFLEEVAGQEA